VAGCRYRRGGDPCNGFQGDYSTTEVDAASPQSPQPGAAGRNPGAIGLVTAGGTIKIVGGTYDGTNIEDVDATNQRASTCHRAQARPSHHPWQLTLDGDDTLTFELNGNTPGTDYDQIAVTGDVTLGGATLSLTAGFTYADCANPDHH